MFQSLTKGSRIYAFFKNEPKFSVGEVAEISKPTPVDIPQFTLNQGFYQPRFTYDIVANIEGQEFKFEKVPGENTIFGYANQTVMLYDNLEDATKGIEEFGKQNEQLADNHDHFVHCADECKNILIQLDPQRKKEAEQAEEIANLRKKVDGIEGSITNIEAMLAKALKGSSKTKED